MLLPVYLNGALTVWEGFRRVGVVTDPVAMIVVTLVPLSRTIVLVLVVSVVAMAIAMATVVDTAPARSGAVGFGIAVGMALVAVGAIVEVGALKPCARLVGVCIARGVGDGRADAISLIDVLMTGVAIIVPITAASPIRMPSSLA